MIIFNRWLPVKGFSAINLFGMIFVRHGVRMNPVLHNHERIHTRQQWEMLIIFFYLWYVVEWLVRWAICHNAHKAYHSIWFEREAYRHERDLHYLEHRHPYAWLPSTTDS